MVSIQPGEFENVNSMLADDFQFSRAAALADSTNL
jgi:hypothetical protein